MKTLPAFIPILLQVMFSVAAFTQDVDYERDIKPLLAEKCSACHGALRQEAGLRLDHGELLRRGGDNGTIIDFENVGRSRILQRVTTEDESERMPPQGEGEPLTAAQLDLLSMWIAGGATSPGDESIPLGPDEHWAWKVPKPVTPPRLDHDPASRNAIDAFVLARQQAAGVQSLPLADRRTRLRRLYFDLIGLPPTPDQQREFLSDASADGWSNVVDRLLDEPAYGQRWGRHWMDVWRYSDWDGYQDEVRGSQRHIWRWRDWIIESLNQDKGYDQMILEMLAGDELAPENPDVLRATGFLARNFHVSNRNIWLDATVEHTAKAFLGMTINCARCHDHKYDPISQRDYYAFRAIFEPHQARTERVEGQADIVKDGLVRAYDAKPDAPTYLFIGGNEKIPDKEHPLEPAVPSIIGLPLEVQPVALAGVAVLPALRDYVEREDLAAAEQKLQSAKEALAKVRDTAAEASLELQLARQSATAATAELASLHARWAADKARFGDRSSSIDTAHSTPMEALCWAAATLERSATIETAKLKLLKKQQSVAAAENAEAKSDQEKQAAIDKAKKELAEAQKNLASVSDKPSDGATYTSVGPVYPDRSTGRRLAMARWITSPRNPLTARVAVNYIWMHHFGEPLVENVFDFGLRSPAPIHRQLLDWLAVELMENSWSMKHLHRLITTSSTYQLASSSDNPALAAMNKQLDPDNRLLWRANVRRLEAEVVRDSLLRVADSLDCSLGGPDIDFQQGETVPRKSVYFRHAYEKQMTMLVVFDAAGPTECYRRSPSIIPQQALALSNSPLAFDQARVLADTLYGQAVSNREAATDEEQNTCFVTSAFEVLLGRPCTAAELDACRDFLGSQTELLANEAKLTKLPGTSQGKVQPAPNATQRARENLIHALMNHNDFITIR